MTAAAYERLQTRIPLGAAAVVCWTAMAALPEQRRLVAFCNADVGSALSLDRLSFAVTFNSPAKLVGEWTLMVAAMMLPMLAGAVGHVRARSLPSRRLRALALFMIGYWAIWVACGFLIVIAMLTLQLMPLAPVVTVALLGSVILVW